MLRREGGQGGDASRGCKDCAFLLFKPEANAVCEADKFRAVEKTVSVQDHGMKVVHVRKEVRDASKTIVAGVTGSPAGGGTLAKLDV